MECGLCVDSVGIQGTPTALVWRHSATSITERCVEAWYGPDWARLNWRRVGGPPPWVTVIYWVRGGRYPTTPPPTAKSDATGRRSTSSGSSDLGGSERRGPITVANDTAVAPHGPAGAHPKKRPPAPSTGSWAVRPSRRGDGSPGQISKRLRVDFPDDETMRISPTRRCRCKVEVRSRGSSCPPSNRASATRASRRTRRRGRSSSGGRS
jgi:hypothetical protein